jgi:hypothetical protein
MSDPGMAHRPDSFYCGAMVRNAHSFEIALCNKPGCTALHIISLDENGEPILNTGIKVESLPAVIKMMQDHLYAIAAMKEK